MELVKFPDSRLRARCEPVEYVTDEVRRTLDGMARKMVEWRGIGLAAPQCGDLRRMFVASVPGKGVRAFVDPSFVDLGAGAVSMAEGCLSIPGLAVELPRPAEVLVRAKNDRGRPFEMRCAGILARCVQHEVDHLDGVLMVDRLDGLGHRFAMQAIWEARLARGR